MGEERVGRETSPDLSPQHGLPSQWLEPTRQRLQGGLKSWLLFYPNCSCISFSFFLSFSLFFLKKKCSCTGTRRLLQEAAVGEPGKQAKKRERKKTTPRLADSEWPRRPEALQWESGWGWLGWEGRAGRRTATCWLVTLGGMLPASLW